MKDISFQLYSARTEADLPRFLGDLKQLGYNQVEGYGALYQDYQALARSLHDSDLQMPTGHFGLDHIEETNWCIDVAKALGIKRIYCPFIAPEARTTGESGWLELAERLARAGQAFKKEGFGFGWHNHAFEFVPTTEGRMPLEIILDTAAEIEWEADLAWIARAQIDPLPWLDRYGSRITAVHVKDIAPTGENEQEGGWADVGHGVIKWPELFSEVRKRTAAQYFVAEHDKPSDPGRFARRAFESMHGWGAGL